MKYYEINETEAKQAREMWSFRDYKKRRRNKRQLTDNAKFALQRVIEELKRSA